MAVTESLRQALFAPRSIAIIGASTDPRKHASLAQQYLRKHGFTGAIYPINPRHSDVLGERAFPSLAAVGQPIDHAFINLPTAAVIDAVTACGAAGIACATILSNGFGEAGPEGAARQQQLLDAARMGNLRILGPNSMGLVSITDHVALSANEALSLPDLLPGGHSLISQSGSLIGALLSRGRSRGIGFAKLVSVGNEADLSVAELGEFLIDDPATDVILLILETLRQRAAFAAMARRAYARGKPVVAFRLGRSAAGAALATSHTGAITGDGRAIDQFLRECGVVTLRNFEALLEVPPLLAGRRATGSKRVAVVTTTGGGATLVVDALSEAGIDVVPPSRAVVDALAAQHIQVSSAPVIDLTLTGTNAATYGAVLTALMASPECDLVVPVVGSSAQFRPDRAVAPIIDAKNGNSGKPLAAFLTPDASESLRLLQREGIPAFRTPESCAESVRAFLNWRAPRTMPPAGHPPQVAAALAAAPGDEARQVFAALGIAHPQESLLPAEPETLDAAIARVTIRFPVAAKIISPDIQHKTEAGGVALNIADTDALRASCKRMLATVAQRRPEARLTGIRIETMERGLAEAIVSYRLDPCVGPIVVLGAGGILAELYRDIAIRMAPVDAATARDMIAEVRGLAPIRGYRGLPEGDLEALADAVVALSQLAAATAPVITDAEINPLLVKAAGEGVTALDGILVWRPGAEA